MRFKENRNWLSVGYNGRQIKAVMFVKENERITNKEYQESFAVARMTATRDLTDLVTKGILVSDETKDSHSYYEF